MFKFRSSDLLRCWNYWIFRCIITWQYEIDGWVECNVFSCLFCYFFNSSYVWSLSVHSPIQNQERYSSKSLPYQHQSYDFARNLLWIIHGKYFNLLMRLCNGEVSKDQQLKYVELECVHLLLLCPIVSHSLSHLLGPGKEEIIRKVTPFEEETF